MAKWKAPADAGPGVSIGGEWFAIDADGFVTTPSDGDYFGALAPFGFEQVPDDAVAEPQAPAAPAEAPEPAPSTDPAPAPIDAPDAPAEAPADAPVEAPEA